MKKIFQSFAAVVLLLGLALVPGHAATYTLTSTTLSAAVTSTSVRTITVASATGFTANTTSLFVDHEEMDVLGVSGTQITVFRGAGGTRATEHLSGSTVYVGTTSLFQTYTQYGRCTASTVLVLPWINVRTGEVQQCLSSSMWVTVGNGTNGAAPSQRISGFCTGTVGSAETEYLNGAACSGATTLTARQTISAAGTLANLRVNSSAAVTGGTNKDVLTVYKNGSATAITCTFTASATACSDITHSVAVAAGDVIAFQFVTASSDAAANVNAAVDKY